MTDTITITREEYDRLVDAAETLSDIRAFDEAKAALASGDEELIPSDFVNRMIDGESPLSVFRDLRGMSQSELSRVSGVNRVQIVDIEAGRSTGSVATLKKLADALGVAIDDLV